MGYKKKREWIGSLEDYLEDGDVVDDEFVAYFTNVMPPRTYKERLIQMGEPYSVVEGSPTFATLEKVDGDWIYRGSCFIGETKDREKG